MARAAPLVPALIAIVPVLPPVTATVRLPDSVSVELPRVMTLVPAAIAALPAGALVWTSAVGSREAGVELLTSVIPDGTAVKVVPSDFPVTVSFLLVVSNAAVMSNPLNTVSAVMAAAASVPLRPSSVTASPAMVRVEPVPKVSVEEPIAERTYVPAFGAVPAVPALSVTVPLVLAVVSAKLPVMVMGVVLLSPVNLRMGLSEVPPSVATAK